MLLLPLLACSHPPVPAETVPTREVAPTPEPPVALEPVGPASPRLDAPPPAASATPRSVAFLQTDKPLYEPGESVWVAVRRMDEALGAPGGKARVYLSLHDPRGGSVNEKLVEERAGFATNDFTLPTSAVGGVWTVVADLPGGLRVQRELVVVGHETPRFQKTLEFVRKAYVPGETVTATVAVNGPDGAPMAGHALSARIRVSGQDLPAQVVTTDGEGHSTVRFTLPTAIDGDDSLLTVMVQDGGLTESIARRIPITLDQLSVRVYPEGGKLVAGLPTRVYFAATRADGKPGDVAGRVLDDRGKEITTFSSFHHGLGRFALTPIAGRTYHLEVRGSATPIPLPTAEPAGCVLTTPDDLDSAIREVRAEVRCTEPQEVSVTAELRGRRLDGARVRVPAGRPARVYLDPGAAETAPGAVRVTLYDAADQPMAERAVFRNRKRQLDVKIQADKTELGPRDDVGLDVTVTAEGQPVEADLSLVVVDDAALTWADDKQGDIVSAMLLESEIPGRVDEPRSFFAEPTGLALDLLLGTAGWRTFQAPPKHEEGRVGKKDSLQRRPKMAKQALGVEQPAEMPHAPPAEPRQPMLAMLATRGDTDRVVQLDPAGLDAALQAGVGGLIGGEGFGVQGGLGGLGQDARGAGLAANDAAVFGKIAGPTPVVTGSAPVVLGSLDKSLIGRVVKRNMNAIRYCYQRELQKTPVLGGRVAMKFTIEPDGHTADVEVHTSTLPSPAVEACLVGRFQNMRFSETNGGGRVVVTYPLIFRPDGDLPDATPVFAPVRTFPEPPKLGPARTDFRETIAWVPNVRTDASGHAHVDVRLSDAITSFRAIAQAAGGGTVGRGDTTIASTLPFSMQVKLPPAAVIGDVLHLPLTLTNTRGEPAEVRVESSLGEPRTVSLPARGSTTVLYDLAVAEATTVSFTAAAAGLTDSFERSLNVVDPGFPASWSVAGQLEGTQGGRVTIDDPRGAGSLTLRAFSDILPTLTQGLDGLLRLPLGCFEQASSSNYPNLLVLRVLERGTSDPALTTRARSLVEQGYQRLTTYEVGGGGYEWFGQAPAHGALTAYGLAEFTQMKEVYHGVDDAMLRRTRELLLARRDGKGGWTSDLRALDSFGHASPEVTDAYVLWALATSGSAGVLGPELDAAENRGATEDDAYRLALHTDALARPRRDAARRLAARLVDLQEEDGAWRKADHSITRSGGRNLHIETTALAVRALLDVGGHPDRVERGVQWLLTQRDGSGRWGSTQGTVLTLDTLSRYAEQAATRGPGRATLLVDGEPSGSIAWGSGPMRPLTIPLPNGEHRVEVRAEGAPIPFTLAADWSTRLPPSVESAKVGVTTRLSAERLDPGEPARLTAEVRNTSNEGLPMVVAEIGIPASLESQTWQLRELVDRKEVDFFETRDSRVYLYWRSFGPGVKRTVNLDLLATVPGETTAPASSAWLYYDDDVKAWAEPVRVRVSRG